MLIVVVVQAIGGVMHHINYKKYQKRTAISHAHIWIGRIIITLGMVNGGLGFELAGEEGVGELVAYGVVAGFIWLAWMSIDVWAALKTRRSQGPNHEKRSQSGN